VTERKSALRWAILGLLLCAAIIVPFVIWEDAMLRVSEQWLASTESRRVVAGATTALLALDLFLPIPSSFVSAGVVVAVGPVLGALAIWTGMSAGAFAGYALGRSGGTRAVERFVGRAELERLGRLMRFGPAMLVVCRGVPVLAEASVVVAGAARMRFWVFALVTGASNLGLAVAYALLSSLGLGGPAAIVTPFALGILVPAVAIAIMKRAVRSRDAN
jgi:uncharacterized membrane protein YdjX (TVP38/TMEM64 family)